MSFLAVRRRKQAALIALLLPGCALAALSFGFAQPTLQIADRSSARPFLNMPSRLPLQPGQWLTTPALPKLRFNAPTALAAAPRTNRLYVCEREGVVKCFDNDPSTSEATVVLDLSAQCQGVSDCGLLGLAFHPEFGLTGSPNRGYFYVFYNYTDAPVRPPNRPSITMKTWDRLARFTVPDGALAADPKSELVLIDQEDDQLFHTGGAMLFHPDDGFLYLAIGDEGAGAGSLGNCQRIDKDLFSGVVRIDVDCDPRRSHPPRRQPATGRTAHYFIPNDNPFVGVPGALEEFWCLGLRSPHRMTLDPVTKRIWLGDVGDGGAEPREEINVIEKGGNYQWNYVEGTVDRRFASRPARIIGVEKPPIHEYPHTDGNTCVIGGYVYRGREHANSLGGKYIFGDFGSGRIWALTHEEGKSPVVEELCALPANACRLTTFGQDHANELYLCDMGSGQIHKLARYGSPAAPLQPQRPLPRLLSQTGVFRNTANLDVAEGLVPYSVNAPLFSDNTVKRRWIAPPPAAAGKIMFKPSGEWTFPAGTVFVKQFDLRVDDTNSQATTRLETRLLVRDPDGSVYGVTYKWRADQREADLLDGALTENLTKTTANAIGALKGVDVGKVVRPGSVVAINQGYELTAPVPDKPAPSTGESLDDRWQFAQRQLSGDFDVRALFEAPPTLMFGIMLRESLESDSPQAAVLVMPDRLVALRTVHPGENGAPTRTIFAPIAVEAGARWLRLQRVGRILKAFVSPDGIRWSRPSTAELDLPESLHFGIVVAAASHADRSPVVVKHLSNVREQAWQYPGRSDCLTCHNANAKFVLGVNARQLNGDCTDAKTGHRGNQLHEWSRLGLFDRALTSADIAACTKLVDVSDTSAKLEERVRSYLDANCAYCHRPNGAQGYFDARFETPLAQQGIVDGPVIADLGVADARVIAPCDDDRSLLYERMKRCDQLKMPPLGRSLRDNAATKAVREWISSLPRTPPKQRLAKRLAVLGGCFVLAIVLGFGTRPWWRRRYGDVGWAARVLPVLPGIAVIAIGLGSCLVRVDHGRDFWILCGVAIAAASTLFGAAHWRSRPVRPGAAQNEGSLSSDVAVLPMPSFDRRRRAA